MNFLDSTGTFYWNFKNEFYVATDVGNYIWSDPSKGGLGTIKYTVLSYQEWIGKSWARLMGDFNIREYTTIDGKEVQVV